VRSLWRSFIRELLRRVRGAVLEALEHEQAPLEKLTMEMHPRGSQPLSLVPGHDRRGRRSAQADLSRPRGESCPNRSRHSKLDLVLAVRATGARNLAVLEYATDLFDPATASRMLEHLCLLLDGAMADPERPISDCR